MNEILRVRIATTIAGLVVALLLLLGGATSNQFLSYETSELIRSIYTSAAGVVFILALLPWAISGSKP